MTAITRLLSCESDNLKFIHVITVWHMNLTFRRQMCRQFDLLNSLFFIVSIFIIASISGVLMTEQFRDMRSYVLSFASQILYVV